MSTLVKGAPKAPFSIASTPKCRGECYSTARIAQPYPWSLQGCIKDYFWSLWYDSIQDWTPVSKTIGKLSIHLANVLMVLFCAAIKRDSVFLLRFPCLSSSFLMWNFTCLLLEISMQLFFFLLSFSAYFCSVDACVVSIVSGHCNQSSSMLFYVVSSHCIDALMLSWTLLLLLIHTICLRHLWGVRFYAL